MTSFKLSDLQHFKWGLLAVLLALGVGSSLVLLSQHSLSVAEHGHQTALSQLNNARNRLAAVTDDQQNMAAYAQEYELLLKRNIIGNEQRLDWIEGLEKIRQRGIVLGFKYTIAPQQPNKTSIPLDSGNFDLNTSEMKLNFDLLHEGQLLDFFDVLRADIKGWFMLDGCTLTRTAAAQTVASGDAPQLSAECTGNWLTLKNRNAP